MNNLNQTVYFDNNLSFLQRLKTVQDLTVGENKWSLYLVNFVSLPLCLTTSVVCSSINYSILYFDPSVSITDFLFSSNYSTRDAAHQIYYSQFYHDVIYIFFAYSKYLCD